MRENIERKQILFLNDDLHKVKMLRIKQNYNGKKIAECKKKKVSKMFLFVFWQTECKSHLSTSGFPTTLIKCFHINKGYKV